MTRPRAVGGGILILLALCCVYGLIATADPSPRAKRFRAGYGLVGGAALVGAGWLLLAGRKSA